MKTIRGRSSNNKIKRLGKKSKGSVATTAVVTAIVMTTTIKAATIVKAHSPPSGTGCLAPARITR
jgi:hypothetical protein